jgi:2-methylisocitrate lyase-like PEP mutase family enzyme
VETKVIGGVDDGRSKCRELRELIEGDEILMTVGVYDGFNAKVVEHAGIRAGITGASPWSRWGKPDIGLRGATETIDSSRMLAEQTDLLLIMDGDTGYGNTVNVYDLVGRAERAGVHSIILEDQKWPKRCGHMPGIGLISETEMVGKIEAAVAAREDPDFTVIARTDAATEFGIDEAIRRANLYVDAGAHAVHADAVRSTEDIVKFVSGVRAPAVVNMGFGLRSRGTTPLVGQEELERLGVGVVHYSGGRGTSARERQLFQAPSDHRAHRKGIRN